MFNVLVYIYIYIYIYIYLIYYTGLLTITNIYLFSITKIILNQYYIVEKKTKYNIFVVY